ncbi:uncharacterized protein LY89DRAFT_719597 [Mollisia scopiformis]|uniref:Uncharacterized protein n=1 Tax=Mollisia scopiformis TaxID=149040 RepID=A0A194X6W5_MOLSC|nr:uncharacterized protein LY89DRAFT_719597 [Mollisia scopiformis]KUJ15918.1 hypothetical protein LY89DRAFT_719597 [Mollisia scopiformis]
MLSQHVRALLPAEISNPRRTIQTSLLRSQCYLSEGKAHLALQQADLALYIASQHNLYMLEAKAQFYRAKCFIDTARWKEARWALVRAASVRDFEREIEYMGKRCQDEIECEAWLAKEEKYWLKMIADRETEAREKAERGMLGLLSEKTASGDAMVLIINLVVWDMHTGPKPGHRVKLPDIEQLLVPATSFTPEISRTPASTETSPTSPIIPTSSPNLLQIQAPPSRRKTPQWLLDEIASSTPFEASPYAVIAPLSFSRKNSLATEEDTIDLYPEALSFPTKDLKATTAKQKATHPSDIGNQPAGINTADFAKAKKVEQQTSETKPHEMSFFAGKSSAKLKIAPATLQHKDILAFKQLARAIGPNDACSQIAEAGLKALDEAQQRNIEEPFYDAAEFVKLKQMATRLETQKKGSGEGGSKDDEEISKLTKKNEELEKENKKLKEQIAKHGKTKIGKLEQDLKEAQDMFQEQKDLTKEKEAEIGRMEEGWIRKEDCKEHEDAEVARLDAEIAALQREISEDGSGKGSDDSEGHKTLRARILELDAELEKSKAQIKKQSDQLKARGLIPGATGDLAECEEENERLTGLLLHYKAENAKPGRSGSADAKSVELGLKNLDVMQRINTRMQTALNDAVTKERALKTDLEALRAEVDVFKTNNTDDILKDCWERRDRLEQEVAGNKTQIDQLKEQLRATIADAKSASEQAARDVATVEADINKMNEGEAQDLLDAQEQARELTQENETIFGLVAKYRDDIEKLKKDLKKKKRSRGKGDSSDEDQRKKKKADAAEIGRLRLEIAKLKRLLRELTSRYEGQRDQSGRMVALNREYMTLLQNARIAYPLADGSGAPDALEDPPEPVGREPSDILASVMEVELAILRAQTEIQWVIAIRGHTGFVAGDLTRATAMIDSALEMVALLPGPLTNPIRTLLGEANWWSFMVRYYSDDLPGAQLALTIAHNCLAYLRLEESRIAVSAWMARPVLPPIPRTRRGYARKDSIKKSKKTSKKGKGGDENKKDTKDKKDEQEKKDKKDKDKDKKEKDKKGKGKQEDDNSDEMDSDDVDGFQGA